MTLLEQKKQLRTQLKQRRSALPASNRHVMSQQIINYLYEIDEFNQAKSIFCYISYLSEVETGALISRLLEQKVTLSVPKIIDKAKMIAVSLSDLSDLEPDNMGILTPKSDESIKNNTFDIAITPGLGFTASGDRIGYGRGYYDRWFSNNSVALKIGVAFETQLVQTLPIEKTDEAIDILITEKRIIDMRPE